MTGDLNLEGSTQKAVSWITDYAPKYDKPGNVYLGTIHRIDRPTTGVIIYAKTSKALSRMNEKFRNNEISKKYWAIVKNKLPKQSDILENYLSKNNKKNKSFVTKGKDGKYIDWFNRKILVTIW